MCQNDDNDIEFRLTEIVCNAVAKKERQDEANSKKGDKHKPTPGGNVNIDTIVHSRTAISEFRKPFFKERAKMKKLRDKAIPVRPRERPPGKG